MIKKELRGVFYLPQRDWGEKISGHVQKNRAGEKKNCHLIGRLKADGLLDLANVFYIRRDNLNNEIT
jgi:hypothetical protein